MTLILTCAACGCEYDGEVEGYASPSCGSSSASYDTDSAGPQFLDEDRR